MLGSVMLWSSMAFVFYSYFGYPLILWVVIYFKSRDVKKGDVLPSVSFIITAHNEEKRICEKIENTLRQDYPRDLFEIIVASDASTDHTESIVESYRSANVRLVRSPERKGKEHAQKCAIDTASGQIFVFSDVATVLEADGVRNIVRNFSDPTVGCVSSMDRIIDSDNRLSGEGAYVKYEMFLRKLESRFNTLVGLSGSFFAARREVCWPWATDLQSDFNTLLNSVSRGLRGVLDVESIGYYRAIADEAKEYERKIRTVVRGIHVLTTHIYFLNPFLYGLFSWQLFSHKLCRWLVPFAMIIAFIANLWLSQYDVAYQALFLFQVLFYSISVIGLRLGRRLNSVILRMPAFFLLVNLSLLHAWYNFLVKREVIARWSPTVR